MPVISGGRAAVAIKHKLGKTLSNIPPVVDISDEDNALLEDEYQINMRAAHTARKARTTSEAALKAQVADLAKELRALRSQMDGGPALPVEDPVGVGAIWWASYGERMDAGTKKEGSEKLIEVIAVREYEVDVVAISNGGRKSTISKETLSKNAGRYVCIRPAGAKRFTFPTQEK